MMSLRLSEGSDMRRYQNLSGKKLNSQVIDNNIENKLLTVNRNHLIATPRGRIILNTILKDLLV